MRSRIRSLVPVLVAVAAMFLPPLAVSAGAAGHVADLGEDVRAFGAAPFAGSTASLDLAQPIVGMAPRPTGGYWEAAADGGVFAFGGAGFHGSLGATRLARPIVGIASTPSGNGYWLVGSDGGIFTFGDARYFGSLGATRLARPIVGIASTPSGNGYWLVGSDGGIFTFGDARYFGSLGGTTIHQFAVGVAATPAGDGYWVVLNGGCGPTSFSPITSTGSGGYAIQTSLDIRTQPGCDTVRFGFRQASTGGVQFSVQAARPPFEGPAGVPIGVRGRSFLEVRVFPGAVHDLETGQPTFRPHLVVGPTGSHVTEVRLIEDFEGVLRWVIGLDRALPFAAFSTTSTSLVVQIAPT